MPTPFLFLSCVFIWGSTWLAITYQLGEMSPIYSVGIRFAIAAVILGFVCLIKRLPMKLPLHLHVRLLLIGICLYTLDYVLLYHSQQYLVSAWLALMSSSIVYMNVVLRKFLFDKPIRKPVVIGAVVSGLGLVLLFWEPLTAVTLETYFYWGLMLAMLSFIFASFGNVISENALDHGTPVIQLNFYAMAYSLPFTFGYGLITGAPFVLPDNMEYWLSLAYLAVFGSVLAFGAYMLLMKRIGSDKAAYVILTYPLVALLLSSIFEDYKWQLSGAFGVLLILTGNYVAMGKSDSLLNRWHNLIRRA